MKKLYMAFAVVLALTVGTVAYAMPPGQPTGSFSCSPIGTFWLHDVFFLDQACHYTGGPDSGEDFFWRTNTEGFSMIYPM